MIIVRDDDDHASIWLRPEGTNLWEAFSGTECSVELPSPSEINGEAICFDAEGKGYYTTTEREGGPKPPIYYFASVDAGLPGTIYVDADAAGANDGTNWADAFNYLQDALSVARNGDEIRVAEGIYKPDEDADNPTGTGDREATFDPNIRDIETYETILSGDLDGNDVDVNDPCDLLTEPTRLENSYHVVTNSNIDETAVLDGFTITAGNANGLPEDERDRGGGMFNNGHDNLCNPTVTGCTFFGNSAAESGGGMFNYEHGDGECSPILTNCAFIRNAGDSEGGGMSSWGGHSVVTNCTFGDNYSRYCGGGMVSAGSNLTVSNCTFSNNSTNGEGGGMW
ncbi:MAG: right-handed parallel beta-helix repeat-containing protein, partial [Planctomycetota bacterium]